MFAARLKSVRHVRPSPSSRIFDGTSAPSAPPRMNNTAAADCWRSIPDDSLPRGKTSTQARLRSRWDRGKPSPPSARESLVCVNITVGPGKYFARLRFAAPRGIDTQKNCFNICLNGHEVVRSLDVAATAGGPNKAVDLVFNHLAPENGVMSIRFTSPKVAEGDQVVRGEAFVQAIEIGPGSGGRGAMPAQSIAASRVGSSNLLLNPGFEETRDGTQAEKRGHDIRNGWTTDLTGSTNCYMWQESAFSQHPDWGVPEFHSGQGAIRVHADVDCHTLIYQDIEVRPEATYTGSVWVRAADLRGKGFGHSTTDSAGLVLRELDDTNKLLVKHELVALKKAGPYTR